MFRQREYDVSFQCRVLRGVGVQQCAVAVIAFHALVVMGNPYIAFMVQQQGNNFFAVEGNGTRLSRSDINKQGFCPSVSCQQGIFIPLIEVGNVVLAVRSQYMGELYGMVFITVLVQTASTSENYSVFPQANGVGYHRIIVFIPHQYELVFYIFIAEHPFFCDCPNVMFFVFQQMGDVSAEIPFQVVAVKTSDARACAYPYIAFFRAHFQAAHHRRQPVLGGNLLKEILFGF